MIKTRLSQSAIKGQDYIIIDNCDKLELQSNDVLIIAGLGSQFSDLYHSEVIVKNVDCTLNKV